MAPRLVALTGAERASLPELFRARVRATPDALFLIHEGRRWTYAEAWGEICGFARFLQARGIGPGGRVASFLTNRPEGLWAFLGTLTAGAAYAPLNRNHRGELLASLIARTGAGLIVSETEAEALLPPGLPLLLADGPAFPRGAAPDPGVATAPGDLAVVMFTSGTTGRSKAVRLPHNMFCRAADDLCGAFGYGPSDVFHLWLPLFHIGGLLHAVSAMIVAGGAVSLHPTFSRSRFWQEVADSGATVFAGFPNVLTLLLGDETAPAAGAHSLRLGMVGGGEADLRARFSERFGVRLLDTYGMTEAEPLTVPTGREPPGSCGVPGRDFELRIVDAEDRPLPAGSAGEIVARPRAPDVMNQGYEGDAEATVAAWRNLWFHTGDLGRVDEDGFVYVLGRLKQMIRKGGENISAWELEQLIAACPGVVEVAVVGVPSPLGEEEVKAVVVGAVDPAAVHAYCLGRMARFMVPRFIEIRERLPRNGVGKVEGELLRNLDGVWDARGTPAP